jgi:hypothetical protein
MNNHTSPRVMAHPSGACLNYRLVLGGDGIDERWGEEALDLAQFSGLAMTREDGRQAEGRQPEG